MKLYCLSGHPTLPCNVLKLKSTTIMLDCGLDTTSVLQFLPLPLVHSPRLSKLPGWVFKDSMINLEKKELLDLSTIDVILISNYHCMMALPYITEHTGFTGTVYATEPMLQIGRVPKAQSATCWKNKEIKRLLPSPLKDAVEVSTWKRCYSIQDVNSALSKVQLVGYSQKVVRSLSSVWCRAEGFLCLWLLPPHQTSTAHGSERYDVLILTGLTQMPTANPDGMLGDFCSNLAMTIRAGGNVLVPCYFSGLIYDLFECLYQFIENANLSSTPFYFISPVANSSLEFSQIFAVVSSRQSKVYLPEPPFPHSETNKLKHYPSTHGDFSSEVRQPCVVFNRHPLNTIVFTEPDFLDASYLDAVAPYQPLAMKCVYCPIDTRLNFHQVSKLVKCFHVRKRLFIPPRSK
uniref:Integrator complex subunit 9 n=1 Tax=Oncorhynchus mykiss TaxID=8022 RepID=A0A8K9V6T9_ONCMY